MVKQKLELEVIFYRNILVDSLQVWLKMFPMGLKLSLFLLYGQRFLRYKIAIFGHEIWHLAKVPEVAHIHSFYPKGVKLILFSLCGQRFPRYGPIFKIAIFGHEIWALAKISELAHIHSFKECICATSEIVTKVSTPGGRN